MMKVAYMIAGALAAIPCVFFLFYTFRLIYVNVTMPDAAAHRSGGMLIGAIAFPLAALFFGGLSWLFVRRSRRS
jgi:hypothetical protein